MGLNSVFFVCTFINTPVLGQNDSLIPPNHHKLLKNDPRSALCLNHPVFCWHKFLQWFWSAFLVAFDVFTNISKVHLLIDNGFTDIGLFSVHVWLGVF